MAKYLVEASYTREGAQGVAREGGSARAAAVARAIESAGGKMEAFYFAFGDTDAYVIVDVPNNVTAAALSLAVNAGGGATVKTTVLLTPEEVDEAIKQSVGYRTPGG